MHLFLLRKVPQNKSRYHHHKKSLRSLQIYTRILHEGPETCNPQNEPIWKLPFLHVALQLEYQCSAFFTYCQETLVVTFCTSGSVAEVETSQHQDPAFSLPSKACPTAQNCMVLGMRTGRMYHVFFTLVIAISSISTGCCVFIAKVGDKEAVPVPARPRPHEPAQGFLVAEITQHCRNAYLLPTFAGLKYT